MKIHALHFFAGKCDTIYNDFAPKPIPFDLNDYLTIIGIIMLLAFIVMCILLLLDVRSKWVGSISREAKPCISLRQTWPES